MAQPSALATILRHPLASKRCLLQFGSEGEEINEVFELLCQYEAVAPIGQGTYGYVCSARDNDLVEKFRVEPPEDYHDPSLSAEEKEEMYNTKTLVAVKKLRQLFENNQPRMWLCATREIQLMMAFRHDNVMSATDFFIPLGGVEMMTYESIRALQSTFDSVYVVMKKMDYTLREVLDSSYIYKNGTGTPDDTNEAPLPCPTTGVALHPLSQDYRKFILYQILCGVGYLHLCPVMHRDLKPENIMLDCMYNTCITDFGQGRDVEVTGDSYAQTVLDNCTQWYAAPETLTLMASSPTGFIDHHSFHGVDVWSIGCIAAEMLLGRPLFATGQMGGPGQLRSIYQVVGHPSDSAIEAIAEHRDATSRDTFIAVMKHIIHASGDSVQRQSRLKEVLQSPFGDVDDDERELIAGMLAWDPRERITIQTALESPYFIKAQYSPVIDPDDTAKRVPSVRPEEISEAVTGRAFLWDLFVQRHPEVGELWHSLVEKHEESMRAQAQTPAAPSA